MSSTAESSKGTIVHDLWGCWAILRAYALSLLSIACFAVWTSPWSLVAAFAATGFSQYAIVMAGHETWHWTLFRSRRLNILVGSWLCSYPVLMRYWEQRANHLEHHRKVGQHDDPDAYYYRWHLSDRGRLVKHCLVAGSGVPFVAYLVCTVLRRPLPKFVKPPLASVETSGTTRMELAGLAVTSAALLLLFTVTIGWMWYFLLWLAPTMTLVPLLLTLRQFLEHRNGDLIIYRSPWIERVLFAPGNFHLHAVHHTLPMVPWFEVPQATDEARRKNPQILEYASYVGEFADFLRGRDRTSTREEAASVQPGGVGI